MKSTAISIAALAILVTMAFAASSASADTLCEDSVGANNECPLGKRVAINGKIAGLATGALFLNLSKNILLKCDSRILGEVTANDGAHTSLLGTLSKFLFTNCMGDCTSGHGVNFPFKYTAIALTGAVTLEKGPGAAGKPAVRFEGCPGAVMCTYTIKGTSVALKYVTDTLVATEIPFELTAGLCTPFFPTEGTIDVTYLITLDVVKEKVEFHETPLYLVSLP